MKKLIFPENVILESGGRSGYWTQLEIPRSDFEKEGSADGIRKYGVTVSLFKDKDLLSKGMATLLVCKKQFELKDFHDFKNVHEEDMELPSESRIKKIFSKGGLLLKVRDKQWFADIAMKASIPLERLKSVEMFAPLDILGHEEEVKSVFKSKEKALLITNALMEFNGGLSGFKNRKGVIVPHIPFFGSNIGPCSYIIHPFDYAITIKKVVFPIKENFCSTIELTSGYSDNLQIFLGDDSMIYIIEHNPKG